MVVRLWGTANGTAVTFTRTEGDRWAVAVPNSGAGAWVLDLWAEDWAGNVGYFATVRLLYSARDLRWRAEILDVGADFTAEDVMGAFSVTGPLADPAPEGLRSRTESADIREEGMA